MNNGRSLTDHRPSTSDPLAEAWTLVDALPCLVGVCDLNLQLVFTNAAVRQTLDLAFLQQALSLHSATQACAIQNSTPQEAFEDRVDLKNLDQTSFIAKLVFSPYQHVGIQGWVFHITDVSKATENDLTLSVITRHSQIGMWHFDLRKKMLYWSDDIYAMLELDPQLIAPNFHDFINKVHPDDKDLVSTRYTEKLAAGELQQLIFRVIDSHGNTRWLESKSELVTDSSNTYKRLQGTLQDITEQKAVERQLEKANADLADTVQILRHVAQYDVLTHLPNRALLADRMQQALLHHERTGRYVAVAFLDLDKFKAINDKHGHNIGDMLLIQVAMRMKATLREEDTISRIGGDEFVLVLGELASPEECEPLIKRLLASLAEPISVDNLSLQVSASIGLTLFPQDKVDAEQLLRHADQAMYLVKESGGNNYRFFDIAQDVAAKSQRESVEKVKSALHKNEFVLYYQPKVNMCTGQLIGAEALIRWQHPERGLLAPIHFLPYIENHELSIELGEWVIETALQQIAFWQARGYKIPVSVNIGALQLQQPDFPQRLHQILLKHPHVKPEYLELEILETSALQDIYLVSSTLDACHKLGVTFALDDFGTGYSSLAYLKRLKADSLKIDQTFVRDMLEDEDDLAIIKGIVSLAGTFKRHVIAEGVETVAHGAALISLGCVLAQGYGIAKPLPAKDLLNWYSHWQPDPSWANKR